ncbi:alpha/beta fold hydrolase [Dictyobacter alpinus]|uniref:alpha/beta fold hydrolase n=1 Tax=Dictyobacter alpinus TaxID=2014873 RepID=UPI001581A29A|nr:hypothetical protein [Dictyobacter alpinus]
MICRNPDAIRNLVCCHGGPGLWDYLAPVAEMIDDLMTVYRYDQRACGRSTGEPPYDVTTAVGPSLILSMHYKTKRTRESGRVV